MPDLLLNTTGEIAVYIEAEGAPITGRTVLVTLTNPRGAQLATAVPAADIGNGWYFYTIAAGDLNLSGTYTAEWNSPGAPAIDLVTKHSCGYVAPGTPTLGDLRTRVAREIGALLYSGVVSQAPDGSTVVDDALVVGGDGEHAGAWLLFTSGTNLGLERRVTGFDADTHTLTVAPAFPATPELGASYMLYHRGVRPSDVTAALNDGIRSIGAAARLEQVDESLATLADQADYPLPAGLNSVHLVEMYDASLGRYVALDPDDWSLRPGGLLHLETAPEDNDVALRVSGLATPETLEREGQYVSVRPDYLIVYAAEALHAQLGGGQLTDPDDHRRVQAYYGARREQERRRAMGRIPANSRRVAAP